ncbi:hypothetical protein M378DRAFT_161837 [Amanita muscaria Koide BX008]|uniref:Uncharacterized protein n=1 Tax=Amanita muscaria (strain Koide BX008) TaxID=946122 RepID=A0A0C2WVL6_AMAMK|nr:hypothetical protein M378DRAFT_161837 [Amanita muscaria Koide BX008]
MARSTRTYPARKSKKARNSIATSTVLNRATVTFNAESVTVTTPYTQRHTGATGYVFRCHLLFPTQRISQ